MRANLATQIRLHHPVSLLNLPAPESFSLDLIFLFLPTIFFLLSISRPPRGMSKQKKSFTLYRNFTLENRPEQALIPKSGRRFEIAGSSR